MSTQANVAVKAAEGSVRQGRIADPHVRGQVARLKAKAESAKADAELNAIANLAGAKRTLDQKVAELKSAGETAFQQVKADVEARVAEFDESLQAIASKIDAR